jgi:hypothetical protein
MTGDREGLLARIGHIRSLAAVREQRQSDTEPTDDQRLRTLEARMAHLEQLLQGLQDSVHRESDRHAKLITELQGQIQPASIGAALADDARKRGL